MEASLCMWKQALLQCSWWKNRVNSFFLKDYFHETDWEVCSWPWQLFTPGITDCPLFVTSDRCIPVKIIPGVWARGIQKYMLMF
jgi:hypothetical protein